MALSLTNLPPYGKLGLAAGLAVGLVFLEYKSAPADLSAKEGQVKGLTEQLDKKQAEIRKGRQAVAKMEELQRDIAGLERKLADLKQILPTQPELGDLLKWIKSLADQTNLDLRVFSPQPLSEQEFLREQPVRMEVIGNYHQLGLFYDRLSKYARIVNVQDVKIIPNLDRSIRATMRSNFVAKTYIYRDEGEGSAGENASSDSSKKSPRKGGAA